ncbi:twitching motility protein PilT [Companilactobacillus sp. RD055328]|uniref:PIN/TRAM domain-containing protein n=1 Tax=Companilactobacillus sp. RD055328 TaxID=2916634 RepID=UPI001FC80F27|nr:PIN/TRAM domain-containing protein [Companilactobacillus sp. RD055328]GKQ42176.1 twitching motility protein PilT [Companilactobacillus sp. RD055328]
MKKRVIQILTVLIGIGVGVGVLPLIWMQLGLFNQVWLRLSIVNALIGAVIFYILSLISTNYILRLVDRAERRLNDLSTGYIAFGSLGLIIGLVLANIISIPLYSMNHPIFSILIPVILMVFFGYLGFRVGTRRIGEWSHIFQSRNKKDEAKSDNEIIKPVEKKDFYQYKILDTSVIIDGRIYAIAKTGFLEGTILVPTFVVHELQLISDSSDALKRERGRRGLDILNTMRTDKNINMESYEGDYDTIPEVDMKLLKLAKTIDGIVVTNDYNLNKVSEFQKVPVLNVNELARTLKPTVIPGEEMTVTVIKAGTERQQGVAYLEDGTMVVVEDGKFFINEELKVVVTSALQTDAGRMIFTKPAHSTKGIQSEDNKSKNENKKK